MKKIFFFICISFLFSCKSDQAADNTLVLGLTEGERNQNYTYRAFTGPTMQYGRTGQEILSLKFHPEGIIFGESYQYFSHDKIFEDIAEAETRNQIIHGEYNAQGSFVFRVVYNEHDLAVFSGQLTDKPLLIPNVGQRSIDGLSVGKTALNHVADAYFNEIIDKKAIISPAISDDFHVSLNNQFYLKTIISHPQLIQHPTKAIMDSFNSGIREKIAAQSMLWFESQSGDEEAAFYEKRGWVNFESKDFDVLVHDEKRFSYIDTISYLDPSIASPRVYLLSYNYDFEENKSLQITDILSNKINHKNFLQKKVIEDIDSNPNKDVLEILLRFELSDFEHWTFDGETLTLYYLPFGEWSYYNIVKAGIPSIKISVAENKAAFK